jgi:hypothetical protein
MNSRVESFDPSAENLGATSDSGDFSGRNSCISQVSKGAASRYDFKIQLQEPFGKLN